MSLAIAYGMKRKHKKMADGGEVGCQESDMDKMSKSVKKAFGNYAEGGVVEEDDRMLNQHGEEEIGPEGMDEDSKAPHERMVEHAVENQADHEDMVGHIMRQRQKHYSKGGRVANDTPISADFADNDFDDLVLRDDLDEHYTGANSGDEIGNDQEDKDRRDIVSMIMKSRAKKGMMPRPA